MYRVIEFFLFNITLYNYSYLKKKNPTFWNTPLWTIYCFRFGFANSFKNFQIKIQLRLCWSSILVYSDVIFRKKNQKYNFSLHENSSDLFWSPVVRRLSVYQLFDFFRCSNEGERPSACGENIEKVKKNNYIFTQQANFNQTWC
jgi:hypothetical protein